jgi:fatty-acyl-CoA synthase
MAKRAMEAWEKGLTMGRDHLLRLAATVSVAIPFFFALAALGTRWGWWDWRHGLVTMTRDWGFGLVVGAVVLALLGLYCVLVVRPWGGRRLLAVAWIVPIAAFAMLGAAMGKASGVPPIHDISTDPAAPPAFSAATLAARGAGSNPIVAPEAATVPFNPQRLSEWSGRTIAEAQAAAYPDIKPLILPDKTPAATLAAAEAALRGAGLEDVRVDATAGRVEGVARTFWFGFRDDVVVSVRAQGGGSRVDVRSVSRVGVSDLGANAARVRAILDAMD